MSGKGIFGFINKIADGFYGFKSCELAISKGGQQENQSVLIRQIG
jgi:hypothetical protein